MPPPVDGSCDEDVDCVAGWVCIAHQCSQPRDAEAAGPPALQVESKELDFGAVPLGVPLSLPVVARNAGGGLLEIRRIEIHEDDSLPEFGSIPAPGDVELDLGPGQDTQIDVTLIGKDLEADQGELCLYSNDPDRPELCVSLTAELKDSFLCLTALEDPSSDPFAKCDADSAALDFGTTFPATPTTRILAIYNGSLDSPPLEVMAPQDLAVTDLAADGAYPFELELSWDAQGAEPIEAADFPLSLGPATAATDLDADVVFAHVTLEQTELGSVAPEQLCVSYRAVVEARTDCVPLVGDVICVDPDPGPPPTPQPRFPWNGYTTGSVWAPGTSRPKLTWEAAHCASSYQLEIDDSCPLGSFQACLFPSPELEESVTGTSFTPSADLPVSEAPPVGLRYYWRLRACSELGCSAWSDVRYLDVARVGKDFNGDGYSDVVVGGYFLDNPEIDEGNAFVYLGGYFGIADEPDISLDNPADQADGRFGSSVASAGDTNGDGYADLIVGASFQGKAFVYLGGSAGIAATPGVTLGPGAGRFGASVASAGDTNGDGYADVIVGASNSNSAFVYFGGSAGISDTPDITLDNPEDQAGGRFGVSVASAGDINGDGYPDVIVGAESQDNLEDGEGNAFVYFGGAASIAETPDITLDNPADQAGGKFGSSVASAGDTNGDGYADVIVGAYRQSSPESSEGNAFIYLGGSAGSMAEPDVTLDNPAGQAGGKLGFSVASAGDTNGDGYADVIIGAPDQASPENQEGNAFVYLGGPTGIAAAPDITLDNPLDQNGGTFGFSVASAGDTNGDGYADVIVGAPAQENDASDFNEGIVFVYLGNFAGVPQTPGITLDSPEDQDSGEFGASVASARPRRGLRLRYGRWIVAACLVINGL